MNELEVRCIRGIVLDTKVSFSMTQICRACNTDRATVIKLIDEGIIDAMGHSPDWRFHGEALLRARRAVRLMHDLGVNLPGAALALDLLERLEQLEGTAPSQ